MPLNERDQYHDQAEALSYKFENSPLVTTDAILLEKRVEVVGIDAKLLELGLEIYEQYRDKTWGLVDCISFVVMREKMLAEVLTFDGDFTQAGFTIVSD